jgi:hypothetical protein
MRWRNGRGSPHADDGRRCRPAPRFLRGSAGIAARRALLDELVVALAALTSTVALARGELAAPETTEVFVGSVETQEPRTLAHRFLLVGSEKVSRSGRELASMVDYRLDHDAGALFLADPLAESERLEITYSWVPLDLPSDFAGIERQEPTPPDSTRMLEQVSESSAADRLARTVDQNLVIGGAKTVAIEVGSNKDAAVEQSLRVSVTGTVGSDVKIAALLSDQNIPLQPEGNTQRLEELDEVLIRIDSKRGSASLGDFVARRDNTAFGNFERRLSGAELTAAFKANSVRGVGASARGDFRTLEFRGVEGKQGPYALGTSASAVIVAGSERVWVDGQSMSRGETGDYVIDYSRGEIEFTKSRLITKDSEIAVDFEIGEQPYSRNFYLGEGTFALPGGGLAWGASVASEVDADDLLNSTLTEERRAALRGGGDGEVLVPGAVCGLEDGDYVEVVDSLSTPPLRYFEFVGADSGTCDVSFTFLGPSRGDYVRDRNVDTGLTFFRFVGVGAGDHTPGLLLAAPRRTSLADMTIRLRRGESVRLDADAAFSQTDLNTLSSIDDGDNEGKAARLAGVWEKKELFGSSITFKTSSSYRGEEREFVPLGRTRHAYLGEVWNFRDTTRADEGAGELRVAFEEPKRWNLEGAYGVLDRQGLFRSDRREGGFRWTGARLARAGFRVESIAREDEADSLGIVEGDLLRERGELALKLGAFEPAVAFWKEEREDRRGDATLSGEDDVEWAGTLGFEPSPVLRSELRFAHRTSDIVEEGVWVRQSIGRTYEVKGEATRRSLRARTSWIRRELDFDRSPPEVDRTTHLTRTDLTHESFRGLLSGEYVYETTSRFATDLLASPGAEPEASLALNASARVRLGAWRRSRSEEDASPSALARLLSRLQSESFARIEEETTRSDRRAIYALDFSKYQDDRFTIFGKILLREEITLFPNAERLSLTARWERIDTEDNRADPKRLDILTQRRVLKARSRMGARTTLEVQGTWQDDSRKDSSTGVEDFSTKLLELREELVYQPSPRTRVSGRAFFVNEKDETTAAKVQGMGLGTAVSSALFRQGRAQADLQWTHPTSSRGEDLGNRFRTRKDNQLEWRGSLDFRVSESVSASVSYTGRAVEGSPSLHFARAEARALF